MKTWKGGSATLDTLILGYMVKGFTLTRLESDNEIALRWSLHLFEGHNTFERYFDGKMDGWTVEHWIESNDAISPEDGPTDKCTTP